MLDSIRKTQFGKLRAARVSIKALKRSKVFEAREKPQGHRLCDCGLPHFFDLSFTWWFVSIVLYVVCVGIWAHGGFWGGLGS